MPDFDDIARRADGADQHQPDGLGAQHAAIGAGAVLVVVFLLAVIIDAAAQAIRG